MQIDARRPVKGMRVSATARVDAKIEASDSPIATETTSNDAADDSVNKNSPVEMQAPSKSIVMSVAGGTYTAIGTASNRPAVRAPGHSSWYRWQPPRRP